MDIMNAPRGIFMSAVLDSFMGGITGAKFCGQILALVCEPGLPTRPVIYDVDPDLKIGKTPGSST